MHTDKAIIMAPVGLMLILVLFVAMAAAIFVVVKYPKARIPLAVTGGILVLLIVPVILFYNLRSTPHQMSKPVEFGDTATVSTNSGNNTHDEKGEPYQRLATNSTIAEPTAPWIAPAPLVASTNAWPPAPGLADVYASETDLVDAVAAWAAEHLADIDDAPIYVNVTNTSPTAPEPPLGALHARIGNTLSMLDANITVYLNDAPQFNATLDIRSLLEPSQLETPNEPMDLAITLTTPEQQHAAIVKLRHVDWVADPLSHRNKGWIVVFSPQHYASSAEALVPLKQAARQQLVRSLQHANPDIPQHHINQAVQNRLALEELKDQHFIQHIQRPYADVYRAAYAIQSDRTTRQQLFSWTQVHNAEAVAEASHHETVRRSAFAATALLIALICVIYVILNAVTKGYYRGTISTMLIIVGLVSAGIMLMFIA